VVNARAKFAPVDVQAALASAALQEPLSPFAARSFSGSVPVFAAAQWATHRSSGEDPVMSFRTTYPFSMPKAAARRGFLAVAWT